MKDGRLHVRDTKEELAKLDEAIKILGYKDRSDWYREVRRKTINEAETKLKEGK